jgi:hypothetical protein
MESSMFCKLTRRLAPLASHTICLISLPIWQQNFRLETTNVSGGRVQRKQQTSLHAIGKSSKIRKATTDPNFLQRKKPKTLQAKKFLFRNFGLLLWTFGDKYPNVQTFEWTQVCRLNDDVNRTLSALIKDWHQQLFIKFSYGKLTRFDNR